MTSGAAAYMVALEGRQPDTGSVNLMATRNRNKWASSHRLLAASALLLPLSWLAMSPVGFSSSIHSNYYGTVEGFFGSSDRGDQKSSIGGILGFRGAIQG